MKAKHKPAEVEVFKYERVDQRNDLKAWCEERGFTAIWPGFNDDPVYINHPNGNSISAGGDMWWSSIIWLVWNGTTMSAHTDWYFRENYELL